MTPGARVVVCFGDKQFTADPERSWLDLADPDHAPSGTGRVDFSDLDALPGCRHLWWSGPDRGLGAALADTVVGPSSRIR